MLNFVFKKERQLEELIFRYLENLTRIQEHFLKAMQTLREMGNCENFEFWIEQTHKFESQADDIRDEVNHLMYSRALIPESREDIMNLLERVDCIPRIFETILHMINSQRMSLPDFILPDVEDLIRFSLESCELMTRQIDVMLKRKEGIRSLMATIDQNESHCDHIERRIIRRIFDSGLDPCSKLQLKEVVLALGEISDQADRVSKFVNILTMKRRV